MPEYEITKFPKLDTSILPYYQEWSAGLSVTNVGVWIYIQNESNYDMAAAYSKLFWPDFIEVDGLVLLAEHYSGSWSRETWDQLMKENPAKIEYIYNHIDMGMFFINNGVSIKNGVYEQVFPTSLFVYLAQTLLISWKHALKEAFPEKEFVFHYYQQSEELGPTIAFWQKKWGAE